MVSEHPRTIAIKFEFTTPRPNRAPRPPGERKARGRLPHITVQLARAHRLQKLLATGVRRVLERPPEKAASAAGQAAPK